MYFCSTIFVEGHDMCVRNVIFMAYCRELLVNTTTGADDVESGELKTARNAQKRAIVAHSATLTADRQIFPQKIGTNQKQKARRIVATRETARGRVFQPRKIAWEMI